MFKKQFDECLVVVQAICIEVHKEKVGNNSDPTKPVDITVVFKRGKQQRKETEKITHKTKGNERENLKLYKEIFEKMQIDDDILQKKMSIETDDSKNENATKRSTIASFFGKKSESVNSSFESDFTQNRSDKFKIYNLNINSKADSESNLFFKRKSKFPYTMEDGLKAYKFKKAEIKLE